MTRSLQLSMTMRQTMRMISLMLHIGIALQKYSVLFLHVCFLLLQVSPWSIAKCQLVNEHPYDWGRPTEISHGNVSQRDMEAGG